VPLAGGKIAFTNLFYWSLLQDSLTDLFYRSFLQISFTDLFYRSLSQISFIDLFHKSLLQIFFTDLFYRTLWHIFFIGLFHKSLSQFCLAGLFQLCFCAIGRRAACFCKALFTGLDPYESGLFCRTLFSCEPVSYLLSAIGRRSSRFCRLFLFSFLTGLDPYQSGLYKWTLFSFSYEPVSYLFEFDGQENRFPLQDFFDVFFWQDLIHTNQVSSTGLFLLHMNRSLFFLSLIGRRTGFLYKTVFICLFDSTYLCGSGLFDRTLSYESVSFVLNLISGWFLLRV